MSDDVRAYWDSQAASFDDEPDHGLRDPAQYAAWRQLLRELTPTSSARIVDLGCGTGSLTALLAALGHEVTGLDLAPAMVQAARAKCAARGVAATVEVDDVAAPTLPAATFDVVVARHVVWALPDPAASLHRWTDLLAPVGRMILVEGCWLTGAGLHSSDLVDLMDARLDLAPVRPLTDPALWGQEINDERYVLVGDRSGPA